LPSGSGRLAADKEKPPAQFGCLRIKNEEIVSEFKKGKYFRIKKRNSFPHLTKKAPAGAFFAASAPASAFYCPPRPLPSLTKILQ
jgi:hypothetical protein